MKVSKRTRQVAILSVAQLLILGVIVGVSIFFVDRSYPKEEKFEVPNELESVAPISQLEVRKVVSLIFDKNSPEEQRSVSFHKFAGDHKEQKNAVLYAITKGEAGEKLRKEAIQMTVDGIKEHQLNLYAGVMQKWSDSALQELQKNPSQDLFKGSTFKLLSDLANQDTLFDERKVQLEQLYRDEPLLAKKVALALAFEGNKKEGFVEILKSLYSKERGIEDASKVTLSEVVISEPALLEALGPHLGSFIPQLADGELLTWMEKLSYFADEDLFEFAEELNKRKVVSGYRAVFLTALLQGDRRSMSPSVKLALVHGIQGNSSKDDVDAYANWLSTDVDRPLLAILASTPNDEVRLEAFGTLGVRSTLREPTLSLMTWTKEKKWEDRGKFAQAIGVLGLGEVSSPSDIEKALDTLMPFAGSGSLLKYMVASNVDTLIVKTLDRVAAITDTDILTKLLRHKNKDVRIAAVKGFVGVNDIYVLQAVSKAYAEEKDPEVRQAYQASGLWVVQGR